MRFISITRTLLLVATVALLAGCKRDVAFTLTYRDTQGLTTGSPVMHNTMRIGEVTAVKDDPSIKRTRVSVRVAA